MKKTEKNTPTQTLTFDLKDVEIKDGKVTIKNIPNIPPVAVKTELPEMTNMLISESKLTGDDCLGFFEKYVSLRGPTARKHYHDLELLRPLSDAGNAESLKKRFDISSTLYYEAMTACDRLAWCFGTLRTHRFNKYPGIKASHKTFFFKLLEEDTYKTVTSCELTMKIDVDEQNIHQIFRFIYSSGAQKLTLSWTPSRTEKEIILFEKDIPELV